NPPGQRQGKETHAGPGLEHRHARGDVGRDQLVGILHPAPDRAHEKIAEPPGAHVFRHECRLSRQYTQTGRPGFRTPFARAPMLRASGKAFYRDPAINLRWAMKCFLVLVMVLSVHAAAAQSTHVRPKITGISHLAVYTSN